MNKKTYTESKTALEKLLSDSHSYLDTAREKNLLNGIEIAKKRKSIETIEKFMFAASHLIHQLEHENSTNHQDPPENYSTTDQIRDLKKTNTPEAREAARSLSISLNRAMYPELY